MVMFPTVIPTIIVIGGTVLVLLALRCSVQLRRRAPRAPPRQGPFFYPRPFLPFVTEELEEGVWIGRTEDEIRYRIGEPREVLDEFVGVGRHWRAPPRARKRVFKTFYYSNFRNGSLYIWVECRGQWIARLMRKKPKFVCLNSLWFRNDIMF
jgi:hypothetical protein